MKKSLKVCLLTTVLFLVFVFQAWAAIIKTNLQAYDAQTGRSVSASTEHIVLILQASTEELGGSYPVSIRDTLTITDLTGRPVGFTVIDEPRQDLRFPNVTGQQTYYYKTIALNDTSGAGVIINVELADFLNRNRDLNFSTIIPFNKRVATVSRITRPVTTP